MVFSWPVYQAFGQQPQPTISGDNMLCPGGTGIVSTQLFDTYQWKRRYYGSTTTELISGAVSQSLVMDYYSFSASYVSVTVTLSEQTATSPEFFVDGYVFLLPYVIISGTYTPGPEGSFMICPGDTIVFELGNPYNTNITWYRNGEAIAGASSQVLKVGRDGVYEVTGAPEVCPEFIQSPGVPLEVVWCPTGKPSQQADKLKVLLNPFFTVIRFPEYVTRTEPNYVVIDLQGKVWKNGRLKDTELNLDVLPSGLYLLLVDGWQAVKLTKR